MVECWRHKPQQCESAAFRAFIRLLCLRASGESYEPVFQAFKSLPENKSYEEMNTPHAPDVIKFFRDCGLVDQYTDADLQRANEVDIDGYGNRGEAKKVYLAVWKP